MDDEQLIRASGSEPVDRVVLTLRQHGTLSRAEIARVTGLAKSTVSETVAELLASGLVVVSTSNRRRAGQGRPGIGVSLNPSAGTWIGIDFGFRNVRAVAADLSHQILASHEVSLGQDYGPDAGLDAAATAAQAVVAKAGVTVGSVTAIGAAVPGPIDPITATVLGTSIIPTWTGIAIADELEARLRRKVLVDNDSNCAALAEHLWGAGQGVHDMVYFKLHSGIGGAIVVNDQLVKGLAGTAGEFGHITLVRDGPLCRCGNRGCLETYVGIPALLEHLRPLRGDGLTFGRFVELVRSGDAASNRIIAEAGDIVGHTAAMIANVTGPQAIVIGGALAQVGEPLLDAVRDSFARSSVIGRQGRRPPTRIAAGTLGRNASALGAVALVLSTLGRTDAAAATV